MIHCTQVCMPHGVPSDHASGKLVQVAATKDDSEKTPVHWHKYDPYQTLAEHNVKQQYDERRPNCLVQCAKTMPTAHCAKVCTEDLRHPFGEAALVEKEEKNSLPGQDCLMGCSKSGQSMLHCAKVCTSNGPKDHGGKLVQLAKKAEEKDPPGVATIKLKGTYLQTSQETMDEKLMQMASKEEKDVPAYGSTTP